jgi:3'-5' exoribonuclease
MTSSSSSAGGHLPFIRTLAADLNGWAYFLCTQKDVRQGRGGDLFISLALQDKTGLIRGRIFNEAARLRDEFDAGDFVKAQGRTDLFNGRVQFIIERIRRVNPDQDKLQGFREEDCVLSAARPVDEMWKELEGLVAGVGDPFILELLQRLTTAHAEQLRIWPAAQTVHHAYRSGFLEHVLSVARVALTLGDAYGANRDLLTAGLTLHATGHLMALQDDQ